MLINNIYSIFRQLESAHSIWYFPYKYVILDILFCQVTTFIKVRAVFVFELQTLSSINFTIIIRLKGSKNKGHTKFYECCDLMKKVYQISLVFKGDTQILQMREV